MGLLILQGCTNVQNEYAPPLGAFPPRASIKLPVPVQAPIYFDA